MKNILILVILVLVATGPALAQSDGYTLFAPMQSTTTYLIDMDGQVVHTWDNPSTAASCVYLLEDGTIIRPYYQENLVFPGTHGGHLQQIAWDGTVLWEFDYSNELHHQHHDVAALPNGNILMVAFEYKTLAEAVAAGRDPATMNRVYLFPETIVEVEPVGTNEGNIVWEWHIWDHLIQDFDATKDNYGVVADHPELLDLNYTLSYNADWLHANSVAYNEEFDQIIISSNNMSEIYVIDHSTTTEEAAGHTGGNSGKGGDLLYRWGNPQVYDAGTADDKKFWYQHDAKWIDAGSPGAGNILVYHNGLNRPGGSYSSVEEIVPPVDVSGNYTLVPGSAYGPADPTWIYSDPDNFMSGFISGAVRLPDGNTVICEGGSGTFFEVTTAGETVWEYINPFPDATHNNVFKVQRYAPDYPGLVNLLGTIGAELTCQPGSGTVPFSTLMTVTLENIYTGQTRRIAGHLDASLAAGQFFPNWRAGYTNVAPGDSYVTSWVQNIPALGTVIGDNLFALVVEDVTPPPYNQPPYPPAGDTVSAGCAVVGMAP
jgi:hypothetical protein